MYCEKCGKKLQDGETCQCDQIGKTGRTKKSPLQTIKRIIKILLWIMIGIILVSGLGAKSGMGNARDGVLEIVSYYINALFVFIIPMVVIMNFMGIRNRLPLFKKKKFLVSVVAFFMLSVLLSIIDVIALTIVDDMYSVEYKTEYEKQQELLVEENDTIHNNDGEEKNSEQQIVSVEEQEVEKKDSYQEDATIPDNNAVLELEDVEDYEIENLNELPVYSMDYLAQYIDSNNLKFPKERYKSKIEKVLNDDTEMIAVEVSGSEKVRYSATVGNSEFYYVGKLKNNVPDGWGKIIRVVTAYESEYEGRVIANIDTTAWGWSDEDELVPLLVYVGEFKDGYYSGYGWKYADNFESEERYVREIGYDYARTSDNIMENILMNCNPIEYMGEFKKSMYDGDGILISYGAREVPYYMTDEEQVELFGVVADREIEFYVGEFKKNALKGEAKHYLLGKLLYEGEYDDWSYDGTGTLYYLGTTQKKYVGEWKNDEYHGKGTLYNEDGTVKYKGKWTMGDYAN